MQGQPNNGRGKFPYLAVGFVVITILLFILGIFLLSISQADAATTGRENGCHTFNIFGHQSVQLNGVDAEFCGFPSNLTETVEGNPGKTVTDFPPTFVATTPPPPTTEISTEVVTDIPTEISTEKPTEVVTETATVTPPVVVTKTPDPEPWTPTPKVPCNNGEGNGGEGCSPSDNGNNDEDNQHPGKGNH